MHPDISYIPDSSVNSALDRELRELFTTCFTQPHDRVFHHQRYFKTPYPHRWVIRDQQNKIIAHTGVHEKEFFLNGSWVQVGGVAEVCVHPDFRGLGYARTLLSVVHKWLFEKEFSFSLLFGDEQIYQSSGYSPASNLCSEIVPMGREGSTALPHVLVRALTDTSWPTQNVYIEGVPF